ncbi:hypothetical protein [Myxococcus fulvus]|uniref:hypothetical protein n=1 Tax=Myxococcus fulvus TaxID=33 RepID=UPI0020BFB169|nr:hypothetical protein [Myxococcus fulvus]MCK8503235.1 hypothetical protein [Myxococcus fulvus]
MDINNLLENLHAYDAHDLIQGAAGLQLMQENADHALRLKAAAALATTLPPAQRGHPMTHHRWRTWLNDSPLARSLELQEDPFSYPLVEEIVFHGGSFLAFPGQFEESAYIIRHLLKAIFLLHKDFPQPAFLDSVRRLVSAVLKVSDSVARKAGLARGTFAVHSARGVVLPPSDRFAELKRAVFFEERELDSLLMEVACDRSSLEPLITRQGEPVIHTLSPYSNPLVLRPFVDCGDGVVVAAPHVLLGSLRHAIISRASEMGCMSELARRYHFAVLDSLKEHLGLMDNQYIGPITDATEEVGCISSSHVFFLDRDKAMPAHLITDALSVYDAALVAGTWSHKGLEEAITKRIQDVETSLLLAEKPPNEVLHLVIFQGVGRMSILGIRKDASSVDAPSLAISAAGLQTISYLEMGNSLALYYFSQAHDRLRERTMVISMDLLDEYAFYRKNKHSYYNSDDKRPDLLTLQPGGAEELRRAVFEKRDLHGVKFVGRDAFGDVTLLHDDRSIPVYVPFPIREPWELIVEGLPLPVWVTSTGDERLSSLGKEFAETVAYWLWQFTPVLSQALGRATSVLNELQIVVELESGEAWFQTEAALASDGPAVSTQLAGNSRIDLHICPSLARKMHGPDNAGERELVAAVLTSIHELLAASQIDTPELAGARLTQSLDTYAPLGLKKKMVLTSMDVAPELGTQGLPPYRKLQETQDDEILDAIGEVVEARYELKPGPIPPDVIAAVLRDAVAYCFKELRALVATLSPVGLLDLIVGHNERIVSEWHRKKFSIPTRMACFTSAPEMVAILKSELPELSNTWIASRFLIEYTSTCPPSGLRPISLNVYDRLIALSFFIFHWGFVSDLVHFKLGNVRVDMLASGRLGVEQRTFEKARDQFFERYLPGQIDASARSFQRHWQVANASAGWEDRPPHVRMIEEATQKEFGIPLSELLMFLVEVENLGYRTPSEPKHCEVARFLDEMAAKLAWELDKVRLAFDLFSISTRADFLLPPKPYAREDAYPWRFNRALSYLRKPLLLHRDGEHHQVVWGNRSVHLARDYLLGICLNGRIRARTKQLQWCNGQLNQLHGREFNDSVATVLSSMPGLLVRRRVKKVGGLRVTRASGEDLGDVDVLVAVPSRRRIIAIEAKSLAMARTPAEFANALESTFESRDDNSCAVDRHIERVAWLRDHTEGCLKLFGIQHENVRKWKVMGIVIVDQELMSPLLARSTLRVLSLRRIKESGLPVD